MAPRRKPDQQDDFYPLKGSSFDVSSQEAYALSPDARVQFVAGLLRALRKEDQRGRLRLKKTPKFRDEMRELRRLVRKRTDECLALDERQWKQNVLSRPSPAHSTHTTHAAEAMVRMGTSFGHVPTKLKQAVAWLDANDTTAQPLTEARFQQHRKKKQVPDLFTRIYRLLDVDDETKNAYRGYTNEVLREIYGHLLQHYNLRSAFPPYHARFLVDYYAPKTGPVTVLDPCAGWGGRLLGTLAIPRTDKVRYVGTDPNRDVQPAYERLTYRITHYLRGEETLGTREASVAALPFEDWLKTKAANALRGKVDVAITSPPYGIGTEIYQLEEDTPKHKKTQSANRYTTYEAWIDGFLRPMCDGVAAMLKPGGVFILNIANVRAKASRLEDHANALLKDAGLVREKDLWKLAMARAVGTQAQDPKHSVIVEGVPYRYEPCFVWRKPDGWKPRRGKGITIRVPRRNNRKRENLTVAKRSHNKTNVILRGDARQLTPSLTYDYVFTSPPDFDEVGTRVNLATYQAFLQDIFALFRPRLGLITVAFTDRKYQSAVIPKHLALYNAMTTLGYTLRSHKIWMKSDKANLYRLTYGNVMTFSTGAWSPKRHRQHKSFAPDVWNDGYGRYRDYTYGMPEMVPTRCILNYTRTGDVVYDPFMGSGTTAVAAIQNQRQYLGTELDKRTYALATSRIAAATAAAGKRQ